MWQCVGRAIHATDHRGRFVTFRSFGGWTVSFRAVILTACGVAVTVAARPRLPRRTPLRPTRPGYEAGSPPGNARLALVDADQGLIWRSIHAMRAVSQFLR